MHHSMLMLATEAAEEGGLFDLNATLPLIALQFLVLVLILNALFYKPLTETIDGRNDYIRKTVTDAREQTEKAEALAQQYQEETSQARLQAAQIVAQAEESAMTIRAEKVAEVQAEIKAKLEAAQAEVDKERQDALRQLEQQVDALSEQIAAKLLGVAG